MSTSPARSVSCRDKASVVFSHLSRLESVWEELCPPLPVFPEDPAPLAAADPADCLFPDSSFSTAGRFPVRAASSSSCSFPISHTHTHTHQRRRNDHTVGHTDPRQPLRRPDAHSSRSAPLGPPAAAVSGLFPLQSLQLRGNFLSQRPHKLPLATARHVTS